MGNHTIIDLFAGRRAQRRLHNLFAQFSATYDALRVYRGRLGFALYAPGGKLDESLLTTLLIRVTDASTGSVHQARINEIMQHDAERHHYYLRTDTLSPVLADTTDEVPAHLSIDIVSPCGTHLFKGTSSPSRYSRIG